VVTLFIFYLHVVGAVALYTIRSQEADWKEGFLAVGFLVLIFVVGWSISTLLLKFFMSEKGFGLWLDRDALSLVLLALMESVFYTVQFRARKRRRAAG
jgi:hypothetical protein